MRFAQRFKVALMGVGLAALAACSTAPSDTAVASAKLLSPRLAASQPTNATSSQPAVPTASDINPSSAQLASARTFQQLGTAVLVRPLKTQPAAPPSTASAPPVSLNIENGDIRELVKNVLGDLLQENFIVDPRVTGTISIRTPKGINRADLIPTLETLLRGVGATLVKDGELWRVGLAAESVAGITTPRLSLGRDRGASVIILSVRNIGAKELQRVMLPFAKGGEASVRADELRNILFLTGTEPEIKHLLEIAEMFDVDIFAGMSILLYPLQSAEAKTVLADWEKVFPPGLNPFAGLLRIAVIERMNALLLVSPRPEMILQARGILDTLDKGDDAGGGARLHVYFVQYGQAEKLQAILQQAMTGARTATIPAATVAPGQQASTLSTLPTIVGNAQPVAPVAVPVRPVTTTLPGGAAGAGTALARNAVIVADKDKNALLIVATPAEYATLEAALRKLDTPPKQVAIEVQIAEVALTGDFQFGLQSYFKGKFSDPANSLSVNNGLGALASGAFSYTWNKAGAVQAVLNLSENKSRVRTLQQPTLITLENQKATFNAQNTISARVPTVTIVNGVSQTTNNYVQIPTGIKLTVTPRVSGKNVFLEIQQDISDATLVDKESTVPNVRSRTSSTTVMVPSGDTMMMGGLYEDHSSNSSNGLPFLSTIPVVGGIFGGQSWTSGRTELVLLITPRVMTSVEETRDVIDELRRKLESIEKFVPEAGTVQFPASADTKALLKAERDAIRAMGDSMRVTVQPDISQRGSQQ